MQVVINVPNWLYHAILEHREPIYSQSLGEAVRDGISLPKGHGRLGDLDAICKDIIETLGIKNETFLLEAEKTVYKRIKNASTIIEADKDGE